MKAFEFDAIIKKHDTLNATYVEFPYDVEKEFNTRGRVKVFATFDGYGYRGSLVTMGHHCHILGLSQNIRKEIGKNPGDLVHVIIRQDLEKRIVEVPEDFKNLLEQNNEAKMFFNSLSYTNQKQYMQWIDSAKKVETRLNRLQQSINKLLSKIKHP